MPRGRSNSTPNLGDSVVSAFHVTTEQHLPNIGRNGLQPSRGGSGGATDTFAQGMPTRQELTQSLQHGTPPGPTRRQLAASFALESQGKVHFTTNQNAVERYVQSQMAVAEHHDNPVLMPVILETRFPVSSANKFRNDKHQSGLSFTTDRTVSSDKLNLFVGDLTTNDNQRVPLKSFLENRNMPSPTYPDALPTSDAATAKFHDNTQRGRRNSI